MDRSHVVGFLVGVVAYYAYLRYSGVIAGMPWAPVAVTRKG